MVRFQQSASNLPSDLRGLVSSQHGGPEPPSFTDMKPRVVMLGCVWPPIFLIYEMGIQ